MRPDYDDDEVVPWGQGEGSTFYKDEPPPSPPAKKIKLHRSELKHIKDDLYHIGEDNGLGMTILRLNGYELTTVGMGVYMKQALESIPLLVGKRIYQKYVLWLDACDLYEKETGKPAFTPFGDGENNRELEYVEWLEAQVEELK